MKGIKPAAFLLFFLLTSVLGYSDGFENRTALIIGNGAYKTAPLRNPGNDAEDMAEKLKELEFAVTLLKDAGKREIDTAVGTFADSLEQNKGVGLFYYAGHGMQVEGQNYLIPVDADIEAENEIAYEGYNVGQVLEKMESAGNPTNIVILDACRDNPFARSFRSSARGLSEVIAPQGSLIVYATAPGDTAAEGRGSNGIFTGALLKNLERTGVDVESMLRDVRAEVISKTEGKQVPWSSSSLIDPFYFAPAELMVARVEAEKQKVENELRALEEEIARRQEAIEAAESDAERQRLEIEQQRQRALQEAKRIEQENLEREAERQREEAERQRRAEEARRIAREQEEERRREMEALAEKKRREAERLRMAGDDPDLLIENIETLEKTINEIETTFASAWRKTKEEIEQTYEIKLEEVEAMKAEPWESDEEFAERQRKERQGVTSEKAAELSRREREHERSKQAQLQELEEKLASAIKSLESKSWTLAGSDVTVTPGEFDRETKKWPFFVESNVPEVPFEKILVKDLQYSSNLQKAYTAIDNAIKAGALAGEIEWRIQILDNPVVKELSIRNRGRKNNEKTMRPVGGSKEKEPPKDYGNEKSKEKKGTNVLEKETISAEYSVVVTAARINNITENEIIIEDYTKEVAAYFEPKKRRTPGPMPVTTVKFISIKNSVEISYKGILLGMTPFTTYVFREGKIEVECFSEIFDERWVQKETVKEGKNIFKTNEAQFFMGDTFAGGIVFYLDGKGGGLVAAPRDQSDGIKWGGYRTEIGNTSTDVGQGAANTRAIVSKRGRGNYAAKLCEDLTLNGYDDWFLPSKDELNLMYENLHKKGVGGFAGDNYWSSSETNHDTAWRQNFGSGYQGNNNGYNNYRVRAVRAF